MTVSTQVPSALPPFPSGKIFITGGSGRIGTVLRRGLRDLGYEVGFTDITKPQDGDLAGYVRTDLADLSAMTAAMQGARAMIHLAGHPRDHEWPTICALNYTGAHNAIQAAIASGVTTIVYASSNQAFGMHPANVVLHAALPYRPAGVYGVSKVFGEAMLRSETEGSNLIAFAWRICAFKPEPTCARDLRLWQSPADAIRLVDRCLRWSEPGFKAIWGVSANARLEIDDPVAHQIGYSPRDNAETFVSSLQNLGVETGVVSEWPHLGGEKAAAWLERHG